MDYFRSDKFAAHVNELLKKHHVPGISVAVMHNEEVESAGYGLASIDPAIPMRTDHLFDIGSMSKSLAAASVGLLVNDDAYPDVQYETPVSKLLPDDFVLADEHYTKTVTVEDILSHRTGIACHDLSYLGPDAEVPDDPRSVTRNLRNLALVAPIRSKYIYSNMMYTVATYLVEQLTGSTYDDYVQKHFFDALDMSSSYPQLPHVQKKGASEHLSKAYVWHEKLADYKGAEILYAPDSQGAGSIISSAPDYLKWVRAMMNKQGPITEDVYTGILKPRTFSDPDGEDAEPYTSPFVYTTGWVTSYYRGHLKVDHGGSVCGMSGHQFFLPDFNFGAVLFGNSDGASTVAMILANELIDALLEIPEAERVDWDAHYTKDVKDEDEVIAKEEEEVRKELCPDLLEVEPQTRPLEDYTGKYWNAGYKGLQVVVKDGGLFVDSSERDFGFILVFTHVCGQTKFTARQYMAEKQGSSLEAVRRVEFELVDDRITRMGVNLDEEMKDLIWFDRQ